MESTQGEKHVVFVDMLGFAALTEAYPIDLVGLRALSHPEVIGETGFQRAKANTLAESYARFQLILHQSRLAYLNVRNATVISFSGSAFVVAQEFLDAMYFGIDVMREMVRHKIPVRIGIGRGSFQILRFRSDVTLATDYYSAEFLGTGIVRSHAAERCGIKGQRILLHPSAIEQEKPETLEKLPLLVCPEHELGNPANVSLEVGYAYLRYNSQFLKPLREMAATAPVEAKEHYEASLAAFKRMTDRFPHAFDEPPDSPDPRGT